ncbi:hypothetical protein ACTA71_007044 [Dictyostelium dimigraforme]
MDNKIVFVNLGNYQDKGDYISFEDVEIKNITLIDSISIIAPLYVFFRKLVSFPFGFIGGNSNLSFFSLSFLFYQTHLLNSFSIIFSGTNLNSYSNSGSTDSTPPMLFNYEIEISSYNSILFKLKLIDDQSGIKSIQTSEFTYILFGESLSSGNSLNATLEFRIPFDSSITSLRICDNAMNCYLYKLDSYYFFQLSNLTFLTSPNTLFSIPKEFDVSDCIQDITFKYNDLSVTDRSIANVMYLDIINFPTNRDFIMQILPNSGDTASAIPINIVTYNSATNRFECEFIVPANINTGQVQYILTLNSYFIFSFSLPSRFQLNIKESLYMDFIGPIVTKVSRYQNGRPYVLGWNFSFENDINGYKDGYILVRSSIDMVVRNISGVLSSGTIFSGTYNFSVTVSPNCISQNYTIFYAKFIDTQGQETIFDKMSILMVTNPFYKLFNNGEDFMNIGLICDSSLLSTNGITLNPILTSFTFSPSSILEVYSNDRKMTFNYTASHPDGLIIHDQVYPIIYLSSYDQEFITGIQSTMINPINSTLVNYITTIEVPIGFGYPGLIIVNCFGFISNAGTHSGYTSNLLKESGFPYKIKPEMNTINILLTESSQLSSNGGKLLIYGRFLSSIATVTVEYNNQDIIHQVKQLSDTQFLLDNILPTDNPIKITAKSTSGAFSNNLIVHPKLFKNTTLPKPSNPSTPTPTQTPIEIKCKTTCGGESNQQQDIVQKHKVFVFAIHLGLVLIVNLKSITVPPPKINQTNPSTEITTPSNSSEITYSSIVSIVSIRELDFSNNVVNNYTFEKWVFKSIIDTDNKKVFNYFSNITINNQVVSNITSTLEWNSNASIIQFAGQDISLNPSSIKYTISISKYNFISQLNTLQLIMSASIQTQDNQLNEECSSKSFGDSSSSPNQNIIDSNYIQLQVNDHSFYGRFIKRCLLDSRTVSITNSILDDNLTEQKSNKVNSFIGINIPWYSNQAIIDPDFSVLLGQSDNSCIGINGDSSLTKSQLIGIIVGSVCFFLVMILILFFILLKRCLFFKIFIYKLFKKRKH